MSNSHNNRITRWNARTLAAVGTVAATMAIAAVAPSAAAAQTPYETFKEICELAGGTASRDWNTGRLICRFPDGSRIWCTPSMRVCGHKKAAATLGTTGEGRQVDPAFQFALIRK